MNMRRQVLAILLDISRRRQKLVNVLIRFASNNELIQRDVFVLIKVHFVEQLIDTLVDSGHELAFVLAVG